MLCSFPIHLHLILCTFGRGILSLSCPTGFFRQSASRLADYFGRAGFSTRTCLHTLTFCSHSLTLYYPLSPSSSILCGCCFGPVDPVREQFSLHLNGLAPSTLLGKAILYRFTKVPMCSSSYRCTPLALFPAISRALYVQQRSTYTGEIIHALP